MRSASRWIYVAVGCVVLLFSGLVYAWSVLSGPIAAEFPHWSTAQLSLTFTIVMSFFCLGGLTCGALSGGAMALSCLFVRQRAHESGRIKALCGELAARLQAQLGAADCAALKPRYHRPDAGCKTVILAAAGILDEIIERENMGSHQEEAE